MLQVNRLFVGVLLYLLFGKHYCTVQINSYAYAFVLIPITTNTAFTFSFFSKAAANNLHRFVACQNYRKEGKDGVGCGVGVGEYPRPLFKTPRQPGAKKACV